MKKTYTLYILLLTLCCFNCNDEPFDPIVYGAIEGIAMNGSNQQILAGVLVSTAPASSSVLTDEEGKFFIERLPIGEYDVILELDGFVKERQTANVFENTTTELTIFLTEKSSTNFPPNPPSESFPSHLSTGTDLEVMLSWKAEDENEEDSLNYDIILYSSTNPQLETIASNYKADSFLLQNLNFGTTYFWQVIVDDGVNTPVNGPVWQFTTKSFPAYRILFTRQVNGIYQIFSGDENGNEIQLTFTQNNAWRPRYNHQRTKIAFISFDGIEKHLFVMQADGSEIQKVTNAVSLESFDEDFINYCWSPNGSTLVYPHYNKLYRIFADGSGLELIKEISNSLSFSSCDWTDEPQPRLVVRTSASNQYDGDIYMMGLDGTDSDFVYQNTSGRTGAGTFSIDGTHILFTHDISGFEGQDGRQLDASIHLYNSNNPNSLSNLSAVSKPDGTNDLDPRYSPDGAFIIFTNTNNDGNSVKNIYKMNLSGVRELLFENAEMPDWR